MRVAEIKEYEDSKVEEITWNQGKWEKTAKKKRTLNNRISTNKNVKNLRENIRNKDIRE